MLLPRQQPRFKLLISLADLDFLDLDAMASTLLQTVWRNDAWVVLELLGMGEARAYSFELPARISLGAWPGTNTLPTEIATLAIAAATGRTNYVA